MGVSSDFVVASEQELHEAFETQTPLEWQVVVKNYSSPPLNPFTGELIEGFKLGPRKVREYTPIGKPFAERRPKPAVPLWRRLLGLVPQPVDSFHHLPHAYMKYMDPVTLGKLRHAIDGTSLNDAVDSIIQVMEHDSGNSSVYQLPPEFVTGLATIEESQLSDVADRWMLAEEVTFDKETATEVIVELRGLAKTAEANDKGLYLAWSL